MAGTPLTDAIEALTTYSNTVTGASDTTLSEAVATLASGYGGGGGDADYDALVALVNGTVTGAFSNADITQIPWNAFQINRVTSLDLPNVTTFANNACYNNGNLTSVNAHKATSIGIAAFRYCSNVNFTQIAFPVLKNS